MFFAAMMKTCTLLCCTFLSIKKIFQNSALYSTTKIDDIILTLYYFYLPGMNYFRQEGKSQLETRSLRKEKTGIFTSKQIKLEKIPKPRHVLLGGLLTQECP